MKIDTQQHINDLDLSC